jgi:tetratricopeptide (TPR) repeat protein
MDQEKLKEVSNDFQRAIRLDPDNLSARKNLIYTYLLSDDLSEAQKEIGEILKVNPNDDFALKMQELLGEETP